MFAQSTGPGLRGGGGWESHDTVLQIAQGAMLAGSASLPAYRQPWFPPLAGLALSLLYQNCRQRNGKDLPEANTSNPSANTHSPEH